MPRMTVTYMRRWKSHLGRHNGQHPQMAIGVRFLQLLKPQTLQEQRAQRLYVAEAPKVAARVCRAFDEWSALREVEPDNERLSNAAAVSRWELMLVVKQAETLTPPRSMLA